MSSMNFNARRDTSHHGPPHPLRDVGALADSVTDVHNVMVKCLFVVNRSCIRKGFQVSSTGKNPEDSNLAWSVEAMQWVLYLSIGHDRCYWEHPAQHGYNVPEHHHACTTFTL
jgi:hypothetical protein